MSHHCALLLTLAVFILVTADAFPRGLSLKGIPQQNVENGEREAVNYASNGVRDSDYFTGNLNKPTQPPYREATTKEPGSYLQSIWDIYFPENGKK